MSKNRNSWWGYVKAVIRDYPILKRELETPLETRITPVYSAVGGRGSGVSDPTANAVIHDLPKSKMRKLEAVEAAMEETKVRFDNWKIRMTIIDLVYFRKSHTIEGAAMHAYVHFNTACAYQADFIKRVAKHLDLPEEIEV